MTKVRGRSYLTARQERVSITNWRQIVGDDVRELGDRFPEWDAATPVISSVELTVDVEGIKKDCALPPDSQLRLVYLWESEGTGLQGCGESRKLFGTQKGEVLTLTASIDGSMLSEQLTLSIQIILINSGKNPSVLSPKIMGTQLWRVERRIYLEGVDPRFPTEFVNFDDFHFPKGAAWHLQWNPDDLHDYVYRSIRLYINNKHPIVKQAVVQPNKEGRHIVEAVLYHVARSLIVGVLNNNDFFDPTITFEEGSVGNIVKRTINRLFPDESYNSIKSLYLDNPERFDTKLQSKLELFWPK